VSADELRLIAAQDWRGVWSEPSGEELLDSLRDVRRTIGQKAEAIGAWGQILAVPDDVEAVLGTAFDWQGVLPYFYLNGTSTPDRLSRRKREDARRAKENLLEQLNRSTLFLTGLANSDEALKTLDDISQAAPQLRIVVFDADAATQTAVSQWAAAQPSESDIRSRVLCLDESLATILKRISALGDQGERPTIRVGSTDIPFQHALQTKPPIDQDFLLITSQDLKTAAKDEDDTELLQGLLRGEKAPWRALRRHLGWDRPVEHARNVFDVVRNWPSKQNVRCIDIPGEPGSGLTTLLKQIAFSLADRGKVVLFHVGPMAGFNLDRVRTFCDAVVREADGVEDPAVVLIFDAPSVLDDATLTLNGLAHRWAERTETRLLLLRGIPVMPKDGRASTGAGTVERNPRYKIHRPKPEQVKRDVLEPLSAILTEEEKDSLKKWVSAYSRRENTIGLASAIDRLDSYQGGQAGAPLLLCLYYLLYDTSYDAATSLGRHLYQLALRNCDELRISAEPGRSSQPDINSKLTPQQLADWMSGTAGQLGITAQRDFTGLDVREGMAFLMTVAALGCLSLSIPRGVLEDVVEVPTGRRLRNVYALEKMGLTMRMTGADESNRYAPAAFYEDRETVRFVHYPLARLLVEWVRSADGREAAAFLRSLNHPELSEICDEIDGGNGLGEYPLNLLRPIIARVEASAEHRRFVDDVSVQYFRLQRRGGGHLEDWKWRNTDLLLEAFQWIQSHVLQQDDVLLHSRGITSYKSVPLPAREDDPASPTDPAVWRPAYEAALRDFEAAYAICEAGRGSEDLGNLLVSMGTAKMWWSKRERLSRHPGALRTPEEWKRLAHEAQDNFELALKLRPDNRYALFGVAVFRLENVEWVLISNGGGVREDLESPLKELETVLVLLSGEPEEYFRDEWENTRKRAIQLLVNAGRDGLLNELKAKHDELGYALEALSSLRGDLITVAANPQGIRKAREIMQAASTDSQVRPCALGDLIRYILFSHDNPGVEHYPARLAKLKRLEKTIYMRQPTWLYDLAMLAFQTGDFRLSNEKFRELRRGRRFYEVPRERICFYRRNGDSRDATLLYLRVLSVDRLESWGRLVDLTFPESIRIAAKSFADEGTELRAGMTTRCVIRLFSSGPLAEPPPRKR
jgi:hypothetical protein